MSDTQMNTEVEEAPKQEEETPLPSYEEIKQSLEDLRAVVAGLKEQADMRQAEAEKQAEEQSEASQEVVPEQTAEEEKPAAPEKEEEPKSVEEMSDMSVPQAVLDAMEDEDNDDPKWRDDTGVYEASEGEHWPEDMSDLANNEDEAEDEDTMDWDNESPYLSV